MHPSTEVQVSVISVAQLVSGGATVLIRPVSVSYASTDGATVATYQGARVYSLTVRSTYMHTSSSFLVSVGSGGTPGRTVSTLTPIEIVLAVGQHLSPPTIEIRNTSSFSSTCDLSVDIVSA